MKIPVLLVLAALNSGCAVHNHYYPASVADHPDGIDEPREAEQSDQGELAAEQPKSPATVASTADFEPEGGIDDRAAPSDIIPSKTNEGRSSVFAGCDVKNHDTGWVIANCSDLTIMLQTGPSARGNLGRLFAYAATYAAEQSMIPASYWGHRKFRDLNGRQVEFVDYDLRKNQPSAFGGTNTDENGEVLAQGIYTFAPSGQGKIGILCQQDGLLELKRCTEIIRRITTEVLTEIVQRPDDAVMVAGVPLKSEGSCYFLRPTELGCPSGGVDWSEGPRQDVEAYISKTIDGLTDTNGIEGFHNPHNISDCRIGDTATRCHEIRYNGVLKSPISITHIAQVDRNQGSMWVKCHFSTSDPAPKICRQMFGI